MKIKKGFTLIELLVVIAIIAVLMAILFPSLNRAKEQGKRAVCLQNLKSLTLAWIMYADGNNQKIINGNAGSPGAWVGTGWHADYAKGTQLPKEQQRAAIYAGSLWYYAKSEDLYKCPTGGKDALVTYTIMDAMNGLRSYRDAGSPFVTNMMNIKQPATRLVFIDEGWLTPDSYAVRYSQKKWWDMPKIRHGNGTTFSFADGSSNYYKWRGSETVTLGKNNDKSQQAEYTPTTEDGIEDLVWIQKGCWGKLGYTP